MIDPALATYFELSVAAIHELVLFIALYDLGGAVPAGDILHRLRERGYFRQDVSRLTPFLRFELPATGRVLREDGCYQVTQKGKIRLRDLCELAISRKSVCTQISPAGFRHIKQLRQSIGFFPFTNGQSVNNGPKERATRGYKVYAILLDEWALQSKYRFINIHRNPKMPCIYVGMTRKSPLRRFDTHRYGRRFIRSDYVYFNGLCLVPLIYSRLNKSRMSKDQALQTEIELAETLRQHGFAAFAGHHDRNKIVHKGKEESP